MNIRYYIDPATELPHIYKHGVEESEIEDVLRRPGDDRLDVKVRGSRLDKPNLGVICV
jgi:hypothetical protein